jgi:hypothetical protein
MVNNRFTKQLWISSGIVAASIALAAGAVSYLANDLSAQADTIMNDRATVQGQTDSVADLASLEGAMPQATQYQLAMDRLLPDQYGLVTFEQWLAQSGKNYGVTANAVFQNSVVSPQGTTPGTAGFSFDAEGSPASVISFLDEVSSKSSGFLLTLNSFDFTNDGTNAKVTGQGTIFFR